MRDSIKRLLSALFESLPSTFMVRMRNRAAVLVSKKPQLLSKRAIRFVLFDVLNVQLATVEIRIEKED